jgi:hypothetical protein
MLMAGKVTHWTKECDRKIQLFRKMEHLGCKLRAHALRGERLYGTFTSCTFTFPPLTVTTK